MKGLSVLAAIVLLVGAHVLSVQLRRARALPTRHSAHAPATARAQAGEARRMVMPPDMVLDL